MQPAVQPPATPVAPAFPQAPANRFPESQETPETPRYAGFWWRTLASIIDAVLLQIVSFIIVFPMAFSMGYSMAGSATQSEIEAAGSVLGFIVGCLINWLWFTLGESSKWQASVGKKLLGMKVTDMEGQRIGFGRANGRYWSKILSALILLIGFIMVAFTKRKQGLHDLIANTLVVRTD